MSITVFIMNMHENLNISKGKEMVKAILDKIRLSYLIPPFYIRFWALSKGAYQYISSRIPTADQFYVIFLFALFIFHFIYLPIFILPHFYLLIHNDSEEGERQVLILICSCNVRDLIPQYTYFNHFSNIFGIHC